ncbi:MAG TPA: TlpA disulfide reductase family protein [Kofleriaceae bacterium]|jgi:thiol-disulfide isomerase/thioredoxin|nr:TlpA disulfide reductase family protein [Kofleriaceae bacterium]
MVMLVAPSACDTKGAKPAVPASRTDGAKVNAGQVTTAEAFCDVHASDDKALPFHWPDLAAGSTAPRAATAWRWINVWATWCDPCIEEMPRIAAWRDKLAAAGTRVELSFVSVDDSDADVEAFRASHPGAPSSIRIANPEARSAWLSSLRLMDGSIPIHLFVSPANRLRCARAGGVREKDYGVVEKLFVE